MNTKIIFGGILALFGLAQGVSASQLLGSISDTDMIGTVGSSDATNVSALFAIGGYGVDCFIVGVCPAITMVQGIGLSSIGTGITIDSTCADFTSVVDALDAGDSLSVGMIPGTSYGTSSGGANDFEVPDFTGEVITSLVLNIDNLVIAPGGWFPQVTGPPVTTTVFNLAFTLDVEGASAIGSSAVVAAAAVPEPGTWLLVVVGFCMLIAQKRWRAR
ncbi:MAG TPA: hypothetical protein VGG72_00930 [Bryobacteraceae bacterium]|jgi:hypothetical protein